MGQKMDPMSEATQALHKIARGTGSIYAEKLSPRLRF